MSLKNRKTFIALTLQLISLFFISCSDHKLKLNTEELENCARWNWIALTDTKKWSKKFIRIFYSYFIISYVLSVLRATWKKDIQGVRRTWFCNQTSLLGLSGKPLLRKQR